MIPQQLHQAAAGQGLQQHHQQQHADAAATLVAEHLPAGIGTGDLRTMASDVRGKLGGQNAVVVLASEDNGKAAFAVAATKQAVQAGVKAGELVKALGQYVDGKGGGKPDLAQGSGANPQGIDAGLGAIRGMLASATVAP